MVQCTYATKGKNLQIKELLLLGEEIQLTKCACDFQHGSADLCGQLHWNPLALLRRLERNRGSWAEDETDSSEMTSPQHVPLLDLE